MLNFEENANEMWGDIEHIANQCPISGGVAVYDARAILLTYDKSRDWNDEDICIKGVDYRKSNPIIVSTTPSTIVYPNPTNNLVNIWLKDYKISEGETLELKIYDIIGKSIYASTASIESSIIEIDTRKISSGNYILEINTSKGYQSKSKFNVYH